jgi:uncharacterized protein involved in response to NO
VTLFALGFRPLYLLAGAFAAISVALWAALFTGWLPARFTYPHPLLHAHEMIFGYAFAVIVGFLFTAGRNWTNQPTPSGWALAGIAALWLAARMLAFSPWPHAALPFDVAFAFAAAIGLGIALVKARNTRNYFFVALLVAFAALNVAFHLAMAGRFMVELPKIIAVALDIVLFIIAVMAGRVVPMFTNNAVPGAGARRVLALERLALGAVLALIAVDMVRAPGWLVAAVAGVGALAHAVRLALWNPLATRAKPILWILHASYAWVAIHLALRALAALGLVAATLATHALTVGAIGGLTQGMMTRTARGHTGRALETGRGETAAYALVMAAAVVRVLVPAAVPSLNIVAIVASGALWSIAFAVFTVLYWPILSRPRLDGRPG